MLGLLIFGDSEAMDKIEDRDLARLTALDRTIDLVAALGGGSTEVLDEVKPRK